MIELVLHPVNLNLRLELALKFAERNFQRPIIKGIYHLEHIAIRMDPKQLSDLIDFVKFQNYSAFYGLIDFIIGSLQFFVLLNRSLSRISSIVSHRIS